MPHDTSTYQIKEELDNAISIPGDSNAAKLDILLNKTLLDHDHDENESNNDNDENDTQSFTKFTYIIGQQIFNSETLAAHVLAHNLNTETAIEIIFFLKVDSPKPNTSFPHDDWVSSIDINDELICSSTFEGTVHLWNLDVPEAATATGAQAESHDRAKKVQKYKDISFKAHSNSIKCVKFLKSDPNSFVTCSSDQTAVIWNIIKDNKRSKEGSQKLKVVPLFKLKGHSEQIETACSTANHLVTAGNDRMVKIWDGTVFEKDEAVMSDGIGQSGQSENEMTPAGDSEAAEPEAKKGSASKGKTRNPILTLSGHTSMIQDSLFDIKPHNVSDFWTASLDQTFRLWDLDIAKNKETIRTAKAILSLDMDCEGGMMATGSTDRHVRIYDRKCLNEKGVVNNLSYHQGWISSVKFNPNNKFQLLSTSYDKGVEGLHFWRN